MTKFDTGTETDLHLKFEKSIEFDFLQRIVILFFISENYFRLENKSKKIRIFFQIYLQSESYKKNDGGLAVIRK
jgi:phosphopantetheinyl transferase